MGGNGTSRKKRKSLRTRTGRLGGNMQIPRVGTRKSPTAWKRHTKDKQEHRKTQNEQHTNKTQKRPKEENNIQEKDIEWRGLIIYLQNIQCITTQRQNTD